VNAEITRETFTSKVASFAATEFLPVISDKATKETVIPCVLTFDQAPSCRRGDPLARL
jgi:hypothetical protein